MNLKTEVCIAGAGPAGTLLACLLLRQGMRVTLVEKLNELGPRFRGEILNDVGVSVLERHHLLERIAEEAVLPLKRIEYWEQGMLTRALLPEETDGNVGVHVPQKDLLKPMLEEALSHESFTYLPGHTVKELVTDESGRTIGIVAACQKTGQSKTIISSLTVGADGRYSAVRKLAGVETVTTDHGYDLLWARIPAPQGWESVIRSSVEEGQQLHLFTQARGFIQIGWNIAKGSYAKLRKESFEPFIGRLIAAFPDLENHVREHIQSWHDFVLLDIFSRQSVTWIKEGLVLIGDAAHTMTPTGAFGLNEALRDAEELAEELGFSLINGDLSLRQLNEFVQERRAVAEELQRRQLEMEAAYAYQFSAV